MLRRLGKSSFQVAVRRVLLRVCCVLGLLFRGRKCNRKPSIPTFPSSFPRCVASGVSSYIRCADRKLVFQIRKSEKGKERKIAFRVRLFRLVLSVFG